jgi:hypothetical protein
MGKKSRRKKENKKARAERLQERRERVQETVDRGDVDFVAEDPAHSSTIFPGDRVWCFGPQRQCRAVVKRESKPGCYKVLPVDAPEPAKGEEDAAFLTVRRGDLVKDTLPWTLRFNVGDKVVCFTKDGWLLAEVSEHFPIQQYLVDELENMPCYKCKIHGEDTWVTVPYDTDEYVVKRVSGTTARFFENDEVMVSTALVEGLRRTRNEPWIRGRVSRVEVFGRRDFYAVYECVVPGSDRRRKLAMYSRIPMNTLHLWIS